MTSGQAIVLRGDARNLPLPDNSVDLIVTSPPYWAQRSYLDGGEHYDRQIGSESTPRQYVDSLLACTAEWLRVLKPSGSLFVNLGDKYASPGGHTDNTASTRLEGRPNLRKQQRADRTTTTYGVARKSLFGLPWRYALGCIDDLGLTLRAEIIWDKPNGLPESVTDRVRRSHETWFHFTAARDYYAAVDLIREPVSGYQRPPGVSRNQPPGQRARSMADTCNPLGRLVGSVWNVATEPLAAPAHLGVDHFAAFPSSWPRRIIDGWCPAGVCTRCGEGREPIVDRGLADDRPGRIQGRSVDALSGAHGPDGRAGSRRAGRVIVTGETCGCPEPDAATRPAVVLDPFGGTGTTALVAAATGRIGISVDRSADYCRLAQWRTTDAGQIAKVLGQPRPRPQADGQAVLDLFGAVGGAA
jgi:DNA modification methylase